MASIIQIRRDTAANWTAADTVLASGELGTETDTGKLKLGDGTTAWTSVAYYSLGLAGYAIGTDVLAPDGDGSALTNLPASGIGEYISTSIAISSDNTALASDDGTSNNNIGIGLSAGNNLTTAHTTVAIGNEAMGLGVVTGNFNTALGYQAGQTLTSGTHNFFAATQAGSLTTTGSNNIGIGNASLGGSGTKTGDNNVGVGYETGWSLTTGQKNTLSGFKAGRSLTSGSFNTCIGNNSGAAILTDRDITCIGSGSGSVHASGRRATFLGGSAGWDHTAGENVTMVGFGAIGSSTTVSNEITLGDTDVTRFRIPGLGIDWTSAPAATTSASDLTSGTLADARFPSTLPALNGSALTNLPIPPATTSASDLTTGTLNGARFPSVLPAVSGAALTNLPIPDATTSASDLTSGTLPDARFPSTLPALDGSALTNLPASGSMVLLSTVTASSSSTVDVEAAFDSTYDEYIIKCIFSCTSPSTLRARLKVGGSYITSPSYQYHTDSSQSNATAYNAVKGNNQSEMVLSGDPATDTSKLVDFSIYVTKPAETQTSKVVRWEGGYVANGAAAEVRRMSGLGYTDQNISAFTGVRLYMGTGVITGTFRIYGIAKT